MKEYNIIENESFLSIISSLKSFMCIIGFSSFDSFKWIMKYAYFLSSFLFLAVGDVSTFLLLLTLLLTVYVLSKWIVENALFGSLLWLVLVISSLVVLAFHLLKELLKSFHKVTLDFWRYACYLLLVCHFISLDKMFYFDIFIKVLLIFFSSQKFSNQLKIYIYMLL